MTTAKSARTSLKRDQKHVASLRELLKSRGYEELRQDSEWNFVLGDKEGHEIDVHSCVSDEQGNAVQGIMYPGDSLKGTGTIGRKTVKCISPECVVKFHSGYELQQKDFDDISAICERFGFELRREYEPFRKAKGEN